MEFASTPLIMKLLLVTRAPFTETFWELRPTAVLSGNYVAGPVESPRIWVKFRVVEGELVQRPRPRWNFARRAQERNSTPVVQASNAAHVCILAVMGQPSRCACFALRVLQSVQDSRIA